MGWEDEGNSKVFVVVNLVCYIIPDRFGLRFFQTLFSKTQRGDRSIYLAADLINDGIINGRV